MKENIIINEVGLRECFQNINKIYNLENKLQILDGLISAGLKNIQLCSFVSPKVLPQMADAEKLNFSAPKIDNITYSAFILNVKGFNRAVNCGFKRLETSISLDDEYGLTNTGMDDKSALNELKKITDLSHKLDIELRIGLQCVWGMRTDKININNLADKIEKIAALDPYKICLADTAGLATPDSINKCLRIIFPLIKAKPLVMHLHQSEQGWQKNVNAAIDMGIREFDSSFGGFGGSPFINRSKGNLPTENLVQLIKEKGFKTGIDSSIIEKIVLKFSRIENVKLFP